MLAKVRSAAVVGLDALPVTVEVDIASQGLPSFAIVGLPGKAIEESRERVRAAIKNSGGEFPAKRITVNLAPADLPKNGPSYDLPIALGILIASGQVSGISDDALFVGELSLDGSLRHTNGVLSIALFASQRKHKELYIPSSNAKEAAIVRDAAIFGVPSLISLFHHASGKERLPKEVPVDFLVLQPQTNFEFDMADIVGQDQVKRALEIAAAGGHNIFLEGPPGAGKTMLARSFPSIMPSLTESEAIEVTKIYSVTGNIPEGESMIASRPFRSPHHTTSRMGLIGGGSQPQPGEISLAHRGVLFLDELPEFPRHVLEAMRQPLEDGFVSISRAAGAVRYPSRFLLVGAANPCPCGNYGSQTKRCSCSGATIERYQKRISGPLLDRIDLSVPVPPVAVDRLTGGKHSQGESSGKIKLRVTNARLHQSKRFQKTGIVSNAEMTTRMVKDYCMASAEAVEFLRGAVVKLGLSARGYYKTLKVARTIADIAADREVSVHHVAEALQYRSSGNGR